MEQFVKKVQALNRNYDIPKIEKAFDLSCKAHAGQVRKSGEPYVCHPIAVAEILLEFHMDTDTIVAALLHDVVEDTNIGLDYLRHEFGDTVAMLVNGVTKVGLVKLTIPGTEATGTQILTLTQEEQKSENIRKILVSMCEDPRVIIIKLADRLHNMRTLSVFRPEKQIRIALETIEFHAPIAHRMGIAHLKDELENTALFYFDRFAHDEITETLEKYKQKREESINIITERVRRRLSDMNPPPQIEGRVKGIYSLYKKYYLTGKSLEEIYDVYAIRIIAATTPDCYSVMGVIHDLFTPLPGRFKDYIANPKSNNYQSLHTTVLGREKQPFEVQIRTREMHNTALFGIAAHWRYKLGEVGGDKSAANPSDNKFALIRQLLDEQQHTDNVDLLAEAIKTDLSADEVHVFTPKGTPVSLPLGATVVDFAYAIHSQVGNTMVSATVHGKVANFSHVLSTGDVIEIKTSDDAPGPNRSWLDYAKTGGAKTKIQNWLKRERRDENISSGRVYVESVLKREGAQATDEELSVLAQKHRFSTLDDFYAAIGYGGVSTVNAAEWIKADFGKDHSIHKNLQEEESEAGTNQGWKKKSGVEVAGIEDCLIKFANCCNPLPGDEIVGFITRGYGVSIHKKECYNIAARLRVENIEENAERIIIAKWTDAPEESYTATLEVIASERSGLLADITSEIAQSKIFINASNSRTLKNGNAIINFTIEIANMEQLGKLMTKINKIEGVISVERGTNN
jgi:GTP pyrophosphokinase